MDSSKTLGLDFGTSFTTMSYLDTQTGKPEVILTPDGAIKTPSVLLFEEKDVHFGQVAMKRFEDALKNDDSDKCQSMMSGIVTSIKSRLGTPNYVKGLPFGRPPMTPLELTTLLLSYFKKTAEAGYFHESIYSINLTYPVTFTSLAKKNLEQAARNAGFNEVTMLHEPLAAVYGYAAKGHRIGRNILVYDLGGGTFDLAFVHRTEEGKFILPISPTGQKDCGGDAFDRLLYNSWSMECKGLHGFGFDDENNMMNVPLLWECRKCRETLSTQEETTIAYFFTSHTKQVKLKITRSDFEKMIAGLVTQTLDLVSEMVFELQSMDYTIDTILLIGGASRTPLIVRKLEELHASGVLPVKPIQTHITDVAVALGAVIDYTKCLEQAHEAKQQGDCYYHGRGVPENKAEAVKWYRKAAEQGDADAQFSLGDCCFHGTGIPENKAEAVQWYRKAAEQGHADGQCSLGFCYNLGEGVTEDEAEAVRWYRKAAEQGLADAQWCLGDSYYYGNGVPENEVEAVKWYRKAAEQGHDYAQHSLGDCYDLGAGIPENKAEAVRWYRKAAEQGNQHAQYSLGNCYDLGEGVPENKAEAVRWYRKAAEQGNQHAQWRLGFYYDLGKDVPENKAEAVRWYRKAAEQGYAIAQNSLGDCYDLGAGIPENKAEAVRWYRKAAEQGYDIAQHSLGDCYYLGEGVPENKVEAVRWYRKAAEQGYDIAQHSLGDCYYLGEGVPENKAEAVRWYRKAAEQGNQDAIDFLRQLGY